MAHTLFLFNPSPRPGVKAGNSGRKTVKKKPRSAAQKAATRKLVALNKSRRSGSSPAKARAKSRPRTRTVVMTSNPAPRPAKKRSTKRAASSAGKVLRYRRNPAARPASTGPLGMLKDAGLGAAGSIGVGFLVDKAFTMLPASVPRSPEVAAGLTLLGALGVSMLAAKAGKRAAGRAIAVGAMTVAADRLARIYIAKVSAPKLAVAPAAVNGLELDYSMNDGMQMYMGEYNEVGEYVNQ